MKAIILSAGEGTRMRPLTLTKPKTMLPVAGKPIIQYNIEALRDCGVKDILLIVGYKEEIVRNYFKDGSHLGVNISYATQSKLEGTADAIGYGKDFIEDSLITLNGDIILDVDILSEIIEDYEKSKPDTLMVLTEVEDPSAFGVVELDGDNIINIVEKPKKEEAPSNLVNAGIYIFNKDIFDKIDRTEISERGEYEITDPVTLQIQDGKTEAQAIADFGDIDDLADNGDSHFPILDRNSDFLHFGLCLSFCCKDKSKMREKQELFYFSAPSVSSRRTGSLAAFTLRRFSRLLLGTRETTG